MACSMLDLPNEVLLYIIGQTSNTDLDNLTSTCKLVCNLAHDVLRDHRARKKAYNSITYCDPESNEEKTTWTHPTLMLRDLHRGDLLYYPTKLAINDPDYDSVWGRYSPDSDVSTEEYCYPDVRYVLKNFPTDIGPLVKACPHVDGNEELTHEILDKGNIGATLGLLLYNLPRLTDLRITDYNLMSDGIVHLKQVLDSMVGATHTEMSGNQRKSTNSVCKLKNITFTRSDKGLTGNIWDLSMHAPFFYIPSVRSVRVEYLTAYQEAWDYPQLHSNIEKLDFYCPDTDIKSFDTYLEAVKNLAEFRYQQNQSAEHFCGKTVSLADLVGRLAVHAGHSLRHLELSDDIHNHVYEGSGGLFIGSLKSFQVLQSIRVEGPMLIKPVESEKFLLLNPDRGRRGNPQRLIDVLPVSLTDITLSSNASTGHGVNSSVALLMLQDLPARKAELLPNLKIINLEFSLAGLKNNAMAGLKKSAMALLCACEEVGVTVTRY
ncbi:MAG: hypothetical protein Q9208_000255 [Pyrenodesmia sp. 3 TL-2023]